MNKETKTWFDLSISRGPITGPLRSTIGLIVHVYADPAIEDFMKTNSDGKKHSLDAFGGVWSPIDGEKLEAYACPKLPAAGQFASRYTIDNVGGALLVSPPNSNALARAGILTDTTPNIANLSFLKLVGISNPEGVRFGIAGAYSKDYLDNLKKILLTEARQLFHDFVVPVNINLRLVEQPGTHGTQKA